MFRKVFNFPYNCESNTYCEPYNKNLRPGLYFLEVWGASGGLYQPGIGVRGKGGYSSGILKLVETTQIYVFIGGCGDNSTSRNPSYGGNNGGGNATYTEKGSTTSLAGGGGGTDIRINSDDLHARVIVAGGGGGCEQIDEGNYGNGGDGGGFEGGFGVDSCYGVSYQGGGGNLTAPGLHHGNGQNPGFGYGGNADQQYSAGGGGGWYGGGAGGEGPHKDGQGGGGSGYIFTTETKQYYPEPCLLTDSYLLQNASTYSGSLSFPGPSGNAENGHVGHGFARISLISIYYCTSQSESFCINNIALVFIMLIEK